jgi:hypothetical protein
VSARAGPEGGTLKGLGCLPIEITFLKAYEIEFDERYVWD